MIRTILFTLFILISINTIAQNEITLISITNDVETRKNPYNGKQEPVRYTFSILTDDADNNKILRLHQISNHDKDAYNNHFTVNQVADGVVVHTMSGVDTIILSCPQLDIYSGGQIIIHYLHSVFTNEWREYKISLDYDGIQWIVKEKETGKQIKAVYIKALWLIFPIGIDSINPIYR